ncbi:MAG: hypothetical protein HY861_05160 [Chlamydiia bacterium]|nr:hypothetical protein [Chlamydiia bacterium]
MSFSPIPPIEHRPLDTSALSREKPFVPEGVAGVQDRLLDPEVPPSTFKKILFDPFVAALLWGLRMVFQFFDMLRTAAFSGTGGSSLDAQQRSFFGHLQTIPQPQEVLAQFERLFSPVEQMEIYRSLGAESQRALSWSENLFGRSAGEDSALGRRMVSENPYLVRHLLLKKMNS